MARRYGEHNIFATILSNSITSQLLALQSHSIINTTNALSLLQIKGLMVVKANVLAYATVFKTASIFLAVGGVAALFIRGDIHGNFPQAKSGETHAIEI